MSEGKPEERGSLKDVSILNIEPDLKKK